MRGTARRTLGSMGYWRKKQVFWRKNQGLDRKPGKWETPQNMIHRDKHNIVNETLASLFIERKKCLL